MSFFPPRHTVFEFRSVMLFAALSLGGGAMAIAQSTAPAMDAQAAAVFAKADKNGDKMLSAEEAKALPALTEQFAKVDLNGDGAISEAEFMKSMQGG